MRTEVEAAGDRPALGALHVHLLAASAAKGDRAAWEDHMAAARVLLLLGGLTLATGVVSAALLGAAVFFDPTLGGEWTLPATVLGLTLAVWLGAADFESAPIP